jgi:hypothetical protein
LAEVLPPRQRWRFLHRQLLGVDEKGTEILLWI